MDEMTAADQQQEAAFPTATDSPPLGYRADPAHFDEMMDADGGVRKPWRALVEALGARGHSDRQERFGRAERYLRDAGIFQRDYAGVESTARRWPLSPFPVLLCETEWTAIAAGLSQRADLLEQVVADIYGANALVAEGLLPPHAVTANPEFLRPLAGVRPAGGHYLHFCAFDLGRDATGAWRVLADRTQAPSAAGFALENRVATTRAFAGLYDRSGIHRLAPFFAGFRDALQASLHARGERVAVLTPGRSTSAYFEQAYLARYLGFTLLEGEDLVVIDGALMVRTISGTKPVHVLWRHLSARKADPLELDETSALGTPGLMESVRAGSVMLVNALGSGIVETGLVAAHLPAIARRLLGRDLSLAALGPFAAGTAHAQAADAPCLGGPAFGTLPSFEGNSGYRPCTAREVLADPARVGQELIRLSRTPVWEEGALHARPVIIRLFAARTASGWTVMPGGFARTASGADDGMLGFHQGGLSADLWVVSERSVPAMTLMNTDAHARVERQAGNLPSRAADNLFWLGRYIERAEGALRILRAYHARLAETGNPELPLLKCVSAHLETLEIDSADPVPRMLLSNIDSAVYSAGNLRDRFSPDGWLALTDLQKTAHRFREKVAAGDDAAHAMTVLLRKLAGFAGLVHENMYRFMGWRFLTIGRHLERGLHMTALLAHLTAQDAPDGADDLLLDIGDNVMTHRRHYSVTTSRTSVIDLMGLDPYNPRSVLFQITEILRSIVQLPDAAEERLKLRRDMEELERTLAGRQAHMLDAASFRQLEGELEAFSDAVALAYLT